MAETTGISWADSTLNPWIGCTKVSPACDNCYAELLATQRLGVAWGPHAERRRTKSQTWNAARRWNRAAQASGKRHLVFCASLADVFDNAVPEAWRTDLWTLIAETPALTWMLVTKRPQNIAKMLPAAWATPSQAQKNIWLGTTVENQEEADRRLPHLLAVPAALHFVSCEPLLGPVDLTRIKGGAAQWTDALSGLVYYGPGNAPIRARLGLVISGGESGSKARPHHPAWHRDLRDQCQDAGVPFHFKQWGEWAPAEAILPRHEVPVRGSDGARWYISTDTWADRVDGHTFEDSQRVYRVGIKRTGHLLDGVEHRAMPDV